MQVFSIPSYELTVPPSSFSAVSRAEPRIWQWEAAFLFTACVTLISTIDDIVYGVKPERLTAYMVAYHASIPLLLQTTFWPSFVMIWVIPFLYVYVH